jgi:DEAD/DEAH box helicase domain-containing protein
MRDIIVFDIETKNDFFEVGGRENMHLLDVSVVGMYSYNDDAFSVVHENELEKLEPIFKNAGLIIGFNIKGFDFPVLKKHLPGIDIAELPLLDLMEEPWKYLKFRPSLNSLVGATFKQKKTADGLEAIKMYREGRIKELTDYCLEDVRLTRDLFNYGKKEGKVLFFDTRSAQEFAVPVSWSKYGENKEEKPPDQASPQNRQGSLF